MPAASYDDILMGYDQAPGIMSGSQGQVFGAQGEIALPGLVVSAGAGVTAPRVAMVLLLSGALLAALKLSGVRFNVGL